MNSLNYDKCWQALYDLIKGNYKLVEKTRGEEFKDIDDFKLRFIDNSTYEDSLSAFKTVFKLLSNSAELKSLVNISLYCGVDLLDYTMLEVITLPDKKKKKIIIEIIVNSLIGWSDFAKKGIRKDKINNIESACQEFSITSPFSSSIN